MAIVICKGTVYKQTISASLTAVAQVISLDESGCAAETFDSTTLDGGVHKTYAHTGYSEPGELSGELFYDPALSGHKFFATLITTPVTNAQQIVFADTGVTTKSFTGVGMEWGYTVDMGNGLKAKFKTKITGNPGWPT